MNRFVILSGCSGGGKSTLLSELQRRGFRTVAEPGRRIVAQEQAAGGTALPWTDLAAFARRALALSIADRKGLPPDGDWTFFDRGIIDAAAALQHATGDDSALDICRQYPSHSTVFLTPPWPQIYAADEERRHDLADALLEYDRLVDLYPRLGYRLAFLPKAGVAERADWLLAQLGSISSAGRL
ncbi:AAA family ATPase [Rhizobium sp. SSA_523]|uniref:AAA family ATPase n=1 Tax=Rhizobium sp. SSA_523 TaxID=2952477 RepID=UPI0020903062|nr:AAA family ATPase [Rhizobium sp. SSA_523]MCO5732084.1 AAA family ATPase [Rhizobium sp. SSA_523]WKC22579.1 AAA family ATPase [Rhizobium sp. SSA_523]